MQRLRQLDALDHSNCFAPISRAAHQIYHIKQQLEAAPNDKRLQHQLMELQILQPWQ
jgi:hypothetical protein